MSKIIDWFKKNKVWLTIIGVLTPIIAILSSVLSLIFLGKDKDDINIVQQTEQEVSDNDRERTDIQNNVDNSVSTVNNIKNKVF